MGWSRRYAIISYLRSSLWTVPLFALVVEQIGVRFLTFIDQSLRWVPALAVTAAEAGDAMDTIASLTIAFLVFTFGWMLVALQVASAQLTPRIIATTLRQTTRSGSPSACSSLPCCSPSAPRRGCMIRCRW